MSETNKQGGLSHGAPYLLHVIHSGAAPELTEPYISLQPPQAQWHWIQFFKDFT